MVQSQRRTSHPFGSLSFTMCSLMSVAVVFLCVVFCTHHTVGWSVDAPAGRGAALAVQPEEGEECREGSGCGGGFKGAGDGQRAVEEMVHFLQDERRGGDDRWRWIAPPRPPPLRSMHSPEAAQHRLPQQENLLRLLEDDFSPLVEDILRAKARNFRVAAAAAAAAAAPKVPTAQTQMAQGLTATGTPHSRPKDTADTAAINSKLELEKVVKKAIEQSDSSLVTTAGSPESTNGTDDQKVHAGDVTVHEMLEHILARTTANTFSDSGAEQTTEQVLRGPTNETTSSKTLEEERFKRTIITAELIKKMLRRGEEKLKMMKKRSLLAPTENSNSASTSNGTMPTEIKYQPTITKSTTGNDYKSNTTKEVIANNTDSKTAAGFTGKADAHNKKILTSHNQEEKLHLKSSTDKVENVELAIEIPPKVSEKDAAEKEFTKRNVKFLKTALDTNMVDDAMRRDRDTALKKTAAVSWQAKDKEIGNYTDLTHNKTGETPLDKNGPKLGENLFSGGVFIRASIIQPRQVEFEADVDADRSESNVESVDVDMLNFEDPNPAESMVQSFEFESPIFKSLSNQFTEKSKVDADEFVNTISNKDTRRQVRKPKSINVPNWNVEFPFIEETLEDVFQRALQDNLFSSQHLQRNYNKNKRINEPQSKLENEKSTQAATHKRHIILDQLLKKKREANISGFVDNDIHISPQKREKIQYDDKNILSDATKEKPDTVAAENATDIYVHMKRSALKNLETNEDFWRNTEKDNFLKIKDKVANSPIHTEESHLPRVKLNLDDLHLHNFRSGMDVNLNGIPGESDMTKAINSVEINDHHIPENVSTDLETLTTQLEHEKVKDERFDEPFQWKETTRIVHKNIPTEDILPLKNFERTSRLADDTADSNTTEVLGTDFQNAVTSKQTNDSSSTKNNLYASKQALDLTVKKTDTKENLSERTIHGKNLPNTAMDIIDSLRFLNDNLKHAVSIINKRDSPDNNTTESKQISDKPAEESNMSSLPPETNETLATTDDKLIHSQKQREALETEIKIPEEKEGEVPPITNDHELKPTVNTTGSSNGSNAHGGDSDVTAMEPKNDTTITMEREERVEQLPPEKSASSVEVKAAEDASPRVGGETMANSNSSATALSREALTPKLLSGTVLHCYQCTSNSTPNCKSDYVDEAYLLPCRFGPQKPKTPACRVIKRVVVWDNEDEDVLERSCQSEPHMKKGGCFNNRWGDQITCDCYTDGCNRNVDALIGFAESAALKGVGQEMFAQDEFRKSVPSSLNAFKNPELRSSVPCLEVPRISIIAIVVPLVTFRSGFTA